jgi:subtilisin family serine protease
LVPTIYRNYYLLILKIKNMSPKLIGPAIAALLFVNSTAEAQEKPRPIPDQYIVVLKESAAQPVVKGGQKNNNREQKVASNKAARDKNVAKLKAVAKGKNIKESSVVNEFADVLVGFTAKLTGAEKKALESDPDVAEVQQDYYVEIGPDKTEANPKEIGAIQDNHNHDGDLHETLTGPNPGAAIDNTYVKNTNPDFAQVVPCGITKAGGFIDGSAKATWIWILDTGIDTDHPDLNVHTNATYAKSFIAGESFEDGHGHGTHCAGTAAAKNNSIGVVGVSAGARVVPVKVLSNTGSGSWSALLAGLNHVAMHDIPGDVVSMSLGGYGYTNCENSSTTIRDAIRNLGNAGTYVVMAAGNDNADANLNRPGCINGNRVFTVGGMTCTNTCYTNSNWNTSSSVPVDWVAVGVSVYSTCRGGGYCTKTGTSMATPHVAGIIHARNGPPVQAGLITCKGKSYKIARR